MATVPSIAYGAEHLIRFYGMLSYMIYCSGSLTFFDATAVRLPKLLYGAVVGQQDIENFLGKFNDLIK